MFFTCTKRWAGMMELAVTFQNFSVNMPKNKKIHPVALLAVMPYYSMHLNDNIMYKNICI